MKRKKKVVVIGGGPAGMMAAGQAANAGAEVILLESKESLGRKLRITGKGRCNLTNTAEKSEFIKRFGKNGRFLYQAFSRFFSDDLIEFFNDLGVKTEIERGGRIFPRGNRAQDVVDAMIKWITASHVRFITNSRVTALESEGRRVVGVHCGKLYYPADGIIIATGGKSYPATGSTGDGYNLARSVGHTIVDTRPALVSLITRDDMVMRLQGLSLKNVMARVLIDSKRGSEQFGEMLFTHYGLSGPIIMTLSREVVDALTAKSSVTISIDLKPALDDKKLDNRLLRDFNEHHMKSMAKILKGLLPQKMIQVALDQTGLPEDLKGNSVTAEQRKRLRLWLKDFRFEISGHRGYEEAIVTAGGVHLKEINPKTLESNLRKNLYIVGELLDLDGETGGYNLQAAFSTGYLAGISV